MNFKRYSIYIFITLAASLSCFATQALKPIAISGGEEMQSTSMQSVSLDASDSQAAFTIEDTIDWLESVRQSDPDFANSMTEEEWTAFIAAIRDE